MDLRGCSRMHFISIIRGGIVVKVPNIVRGKPGPKVLSVEEIYTSIDSQCGDSLAKHPVKVDRSLAMPCGFEIKTESVEEVDELDFGSTTLKQLKDICNSRKRKIPSSVDLTVVKEEEDDDLKSDENEFDLRETLTSLKKLMRSKGRKKGISSSKHCEPVKIKVEEAEFECAQQQARSLTLNDDDPRSLTHHHTARAVEHCCPDQDLDTTSGNLQSDLDQHSNEHSVHPVSIETSSCYLNQVSYECLDDSEPHNPLITYHPRNEENMKVDSSVVIGDQSFLFCDSNVKKESDNNDLMACDVATETVLSEHDYSDFEDQNIHHPDGNTSEMHVPCMGPDGDHQNPEITTLGDAVEFANGNQDIVGEVLRKPATNCNSVVDSDNYSMDSITTAVEDERSSVRAFTTEEESSSSLVPENDFHATEPLKNAEASISFADHTITEAKALSRGWKNCEVVLEDNNCLPLVNSMESLCIVTSAEDNQSSTYDIDVSGPVCSPEIQPCAVIGHEIGSGASEGNYDNKLLQQPPEKLFSARKTISPNSKEKLCKAMDLAEMQDDQVLSCKEKLSFEQNCADAASSRPKVKKARIILTSKRMNNLCSTDIRSTTRQKNLSFVKGNGRGAYSSPSLHAGNQCNSSLSCSQNAIAFSQQQMVDIERLAQKLLTELHSMKEIVVDSLHSESRTCTTSKNNTDKARVAVENVKKVEETTKRWLSIMSRDCHRFCKILEVAETNSSSPGKSNDKCTPEKAENCQNNPSLEKKQDDEELSPSTSTVSRERKIMFADEAGDSLCHVRVLEAKE